MMLAAESHVEPRVNIIDKSDEEIRVIADPLWRDLVKNSNEGKYGDFVKNFSSAFALAMDMAKSLDPSVYVKDIAKITAPSSGATVVGG